VHMKVLFLGFTFVVCSVVIGCSERNQTSPEITVKNETKEDQTLLVKQSLQPKIMKTEIEHNTIQSSPPSIASGTKDDIVLLDVPIIKQNPELKYGCEVTSLAMLLQYSGVKTNKMKLANELPKDNDPMKKTASGDITHWGNPDQGFVGDITGKSAGYAVYAGPLEKLMNQYLKNRTINLTRKSFDEVLEQIKKGKPVILWTTGDYKIPDRWESWKHGKEEINTPLDLHAVVLVGFDKEHLYINDPLTGKKALKTKKASFLKSWKALGQQALSYN